LHLPPECDALPKGLEFGRFRLHPARLPARVGNVPHLEDRSCGAIGRRPAALGEEMDRAHGLCGRSAFRRAHCRSRLAVAVRDIGSAVPDGGDNLFLNRATGDRFLRWLMSLAGLNGSLGWPRRCRFMAPARRSGGDADACLTERLQGRSPAEPVRLSEFHFREGRFAGT